MANRLAEVKCPHCEIAINLRDARNYDRELSDAIQLIQVHVEVLHSGDKDSTNQRRPLQNRGEYPATSNAEATTGKETKDKESQSSN